MSEVKHRSPLVGQRDAMRGAGAGDGAGVVLFERPFLEHLSIRGNPRDAAFIEACRRVLGVEPPLVPNTVAEGESTVVAWLGPDEWLAMTGPEAGETLAASLRDGLGELHSAVTDVGSGQTVIAVQGEHAADVLAKGTPLDLHPRELGAGRCAQTVVARSAAFIRVVEPGRAFEVVVRRSFADYLWQWLRDAAGEYRCAVLEPRPHLQLTGAAAAADAAPVT